MTSPSEPPSSCPHSGDLPVIEFPRLWHVGTLDPADKRPGSFEGAGLSLSRHPGAWRAIARGAVSGPCWSTDAHGRRFLDAHAMTDAQKSNVMAWGVAEGLCIPASLWKVVQWDDEAEVERHFHVATRDEAIEEIGLDDDEIEEGMVLEIQSHVSTGALEARTLADGPVLGDDQVLDHLLPLWAETMPSIDGVWWDDDLDVLSYSAPRGCIPAARACQWTFLPAEFEPEEESDHEDEDEEVD